MRSSDWSSDVCSSDLEVRGAHVDVLGALDVGGGELLGGAHVDHGVLAGLDEVHGGRGVDLLHGSGAGGAGGGGQEQDGGGARKGEIGRASCRERVCQYV